MMLKISDLKVNYGGIEAVKGISFTVPEKSIVTLIGANGAGKSTTLRTIAGLVKPQSGKIEFLGEDITGKGVEDIVSRNITMVPEGRKIFPDLTVLENLKIGAYLRKDDITDDLNYVFDLFLVLKRNLAAWRDTIRWRTTDAGGWQGTMSRPKLMMMDEPSLGLAPLVVRNIFEIIQEINKQGVTILLIEQNAIWP